MFFQNFQEKIPKQARKVFKGIIFDIYQWPRKMYDGSIATWELLWRPDSVQVFSIIDNKILIEEQEQPGKKLIFSALPGGRVDEGEKPLGAAKREMQEETGYQAKKWQLWKTRPMGHKTAATVHYYIARDCYQFQEQKVDSGEKIRLKLATFDELLMLSEDDTFRDIWLQNYLLRCRLNREMMDKFRQELFKK